MRTLNANRKAPTLLLPTLVLFFACVSASASPTDPCSLNSTVTDAKVTIAIAGGKTSFREGEIIPLTLSFTSTAEKRYWVDDRRYDRSGRLSIETYCLDPEAPDPLADYFRADVFIGGGLMSERQLSAKPFTAAADLNEWRRPRPGHYRFHVVSYRVWRPSKHPEAGPPDQEYVTLVSNTIEFDVIGAGAEWREEQLQEATAAYKSAAADEQVAAARTLRFLDTRQSEEQLAELFWSLNDQPGGSDLMFGLFSSQYRAEAIADMLREIKNPDHPITQDFLYALTKLQIDADPAWSPPENDHAREAVWEDYWSKRQDHERELKQSLVALAVAALPEKTGRARALTADTLAALPDLLDAATATQMREQLIAEWEYLPEQNRENLIQYGWPQIGGANMLPILKEFVSRSAPPHSSMFSLARDAALKHIYDLDAGEGRSLILESLREGRPPDISLVKLLSAEDLHPFVQDAVARIDHNDADDMDYRLVELYGDESDLGVVEAAFKEHLGEWACDSQGAMLRYLLKLDPDLGVQEVQASLAARSQTGCYRTLLQDLGKYLPKAEQVAISALDDADLQLASNAALALGRWGTPNAEAALWGRLERLHQEWQGRESELRQMPEDSGPAALSAALESALVNSIATGMTWICPPEKLDRLSALASPQQQRQIASWSEQWRNGGAVIGPTYFPEDQPSFTVLQYSQLDEEQLRAKLSQFPGGTKLYFQFWKPGHVLPPVSMQEQDAIFQSLRSYALQYGVTLEGRDGP